MLGKLLKYCWNPDYVVRLFDKRFAHYEGEFHERTVTNGKVLEIDDPIIHNTFPSIRDYFIKVNNYSGTQARLLYEQRTPFKTEMLISRSWAMFTQMLLGRKGLLDGKRGLILAMMEGIKSFLTYAKLYELYEKEKGEK